MLKRPSIFVLGAIAASLLFTKAAANPVGERYQSSRTLEVIERSLPEYPRRAEKLAMEGYSIVEFTVLPDGSVIEPVVRETSHNIFGNAAAEAIQAWKFVPMIEGDTPVPIRSSMRFQFVGNEPR